MVVRELITKLGYDLDSSKLTSYEKSAQAVSKRMTSIGKSMTTFVTLPILAAAGAAVNAFSRQNIAMAQVQAGLESTNNASGKTLDELKRKAKELQRETLFGDEKILQEATAQLLTFTNIAGEQFDRTQKAVLDLATRIGGPNASLTSHAIMLGKAMNDPVVGMTAMRRVGISFTNQQIDMVKSMVASGDLMGAQNFILGELERQYGGSAKAARDASSGFKAFQNDLGDMAETFGEVVFPAVRSLFGILSRFVKFIGSMPKPVKIVIVAVLAFAAAMGPLLLIGGKLLLMITMLIAHKAIVLTFLAAVKGGLIAIGAVLLKIILPLAVIVLIVEDIIAWLQGGESVFGDFVGPVEEFMDNVVFWLDLIDKKVKEFFGKHKQEWTDFFGNLGYWAGKAGAGIAGAAGSVGGFFGSGGGTDPVLAGAAIAGAGGGNTTVSIQGGPITVDVAAGTPAEQADSLARVVSAAVHKSLEVESRRAVKSNAVVE